MKSGWTRRIRAAAAVLALAGGLWAQGAGAADAEIRNVTAQFLWPWDRVGIQYEVFGKVASEATTNVRLEVTAIDHDGNVPYTAMSDALSGDTGREEGIHRVIWNLDQQALKFHSTNMTFSVAYMLLYCVIDLSAGSNAASYPVTYMNEPPSGGFNTDAYKTSKLVLRRIDPDPFQDGDTTLEKPYYIGLFEVTQKQWELVTGNNPSEFNGDARPVEKVSWNTIRGNSEWPDTSAVSADSFMGLLQTRTGLAFDLPTEAQWEYACRAGTTTKYSYGANADGDYMWYSLNSSNMTHEVGTKLPNGWGLYDMHGNVYEFCLDPYYDSFNAKRVIRGGSWANGERSCTSTYRAGLNQSSGIYSRGFRLVRTLSE